MTTDQLREKLVRLMELREETTGTKAAHAQANSGLFDKVNDLFSDEILNVTQLEEKARMLAEQVAILEEEVRADAVLFYNETGEKEPFGRNIGTYVREYKVADFKIEEARLWAIERQRDELLKLDTSAFTRLVTSKNPPHDVPAIVREEPRGRIASDLSKFKKTQQ